MEYGIISLSIVPLRAEPGDRFEQVTQMLFGEIFSILEKQEKWLYILSEHDQYKGWIDYKQFVSIPESEFRLLLKQRTLTTKTLTFLSLKAGNKNSSSNFKSKIGLAPGSYLPHFRDNSCSILDQEYAVEDAQDAAIQLVKPEKARIKDEWISQFLYAPYQWGGRSPFGVDCSGLTQILLRLSGVSLPRDASQQAQVGSPVSFLEESQHGDLAFFDNAEGRIVHVGVLLEKDRIIHASGQVRIDLIDHEGIFNQDRGVYTHKLRTIRRVL